jgi:GTP diphosphokinase / guanosine-3',5'-bis(diphosphate) 3'-diphosphatase
MAHEEDIRQILAGLSFAASKHRGQRRKDATKSPYINHPIEVADVLWNVGGIRELPVLLAALLHDTVEDTDTAPDEIRERFGDEVLSYVMEETDDKRLPKPERKRLQIERAAGKSLPAKCIKLADFISNLRDINRNPPADWPVERIREYLLWTEKVAAGMRGANPELEACYDVELARGKKIYQDLTKK